MGELRLTPEQDKELADMKNEVYAACITKFVGGTPVGLAFSITPYVIKVVFDSERIAQNIISAVEQLSILRERQRQDFLNKKDEVFNV